VNKKVNNGQVDPNLSYVDATEEQLYNLWCAYYPAGSGPLSTMRTVCAMIENLAHLRGFDVSKWVRP
jgi:hypothetical protein